ncbi:MAG TPA: sulfatase-like hydrolase/transferase [Vicinamibacterales bacterium]|nr:sulfatase-like hydrolase/transferase [Vicinamibacterales bacterium]
MSVLPDDPSRGRARAMVVLAIAIAAAAAAWLVLPRDSAAPSANGPIVLISIDTLRADRLPAYGYQGVRTPAIDRLAADGIVFERAYAHSPLTLPSHASMLTGKLPFEHGVRDNIGFALPATDRHLGHELKDAGFATAGVVSSYVLRKDTGIGAGFDFYDSEMPPASSEMPFGDVQRDGSDSLGVARTWLDSLASDRFFLFFHLYEPHTPYTPPPAFSRYAPYDGEIAYADSIVGELLAQLRDKGLYDQATIVLLSDHGEGLGDHGEEEHGVFLYDESIRVPLIVKLPRQDAAGRRVSAPVQHIDVLPTILDLVDREVPSGLRGRSLRPLLTGDGVLPERGIYSESLYPRYHFGWSELFALTSAQHRYIKAPREELYDLQQDPGERHNLADKEPSAAAAMRRGLDSLLAAHAVTSPASVSSEERSRLQALGYVATPVDRGLPGQDLPDPKDRIAVLDQLKAAADHTRAGQYDAASRQLRAVLHDNPAMASAWQQLGNVLTLAGRLGEAVEAFKQYVTRDPRNANILATLADALVRLGRLDEAQAHAELAAAVAETQDVRAKLDAREALLRVALARQDAAAVERHAQAARQLDPGSPLPAYARARAHYDRKQFAAALPHFAEAVAHVQRRTLRMPELHFHYGDALANLERYAEAETQFREELRWFPHNVRAYASLAMLYRATGRDGEAERAIADLLRASPTPAGHDLAAQLWTMFGEPARAAAVRAQSPP